ncbi:hypothetical protein QDR37_07335 [Amnibacterium sp. CER49]|uniref:DNA-3-methyladenine glycosylase family protein n=1 Tax=Amnibacterium sp. CER49 TaxID=3039161 RepID=UPI00244B2076|nr:hypothetical protein [Amnibacterium sp. CER49]MDH2443754.1 hypothetical protein [Amnibacterium sp. CER49]
MAEHAVEVAVLGPWSLETSRRFWEGFRPTALQGQEPGALRTTFLVEADWSRAEAVIRQDGDHALLALSGSGDLEAAATQTARFLAIDVDGGGWPAVGDRDPVIADAQRALPGFRPCGFFSPYEAAAWCVLSQRVRVEQAASLRRRLVAEHGDDGAFPAPERIRGLDLGLPGRKTEYLHAVADAALDGRLDGAVLRALDPAEAVAAVQEVKGLGPFAAELVVVRGANAPDALPAHEPRLEEEVAARYGDDARLPVVAEGWRPYRTWAAVHLRALRDERLAATSG